MKLKSILPRVFLAIAAFFIGYLGYSRWIKNKGSQELSPEALRERRLAAIEERERSIREIEERRLGEGEINEQSRQHVPPSFERRDSAEFEGQGNPIFTEQPRIQDTPLIAQPVQGNRPISPQRQQHSTTESETSTEQENEPRSQTMSHPNLEEMRRRRLDIFERRSPRETE